MHDLQFSDSARPDPVTILRLPMRPYSIGHEITLLAQRNPIAFTGFSELPLNLQCSALIRAVLICYRTWGQNHRPERNLWLWGRLIRKTDHLKALARFIEYRNAGSSCPPFPTQEHYEIAAGLKGEEKGREFGGSYLARLTAYAAGLCRALGVETPFDVPLGLANYLYFCELEVAGNVRIENAREAQVKAEMAEHLAEIAKEKEAEKCQP